MGAAFKAFFSALASFFMGCDELAKGFHNVGKVANEYSADMLDDARAARLIKRKQLAEETGITLD